MRRSLAVLGLLAVCVGAGRARANPAMQRVVVDRVDLEPSPISGFDRLRIFVSAVDLAASGKVMDVFGEHAWKLQVGGSVVSIPYLAGFYGGADADTALVLVVETSASYGADLKAIQAALSDELLAKLPPRTQVAVIGYGDQLVVGKLGTPKQAQAKLASLVAETDSATPSLAIAIDKAIATLKKVKTTPEGQPVRKLIVVVSDGVDKGADEQGLNRAEIPKLGAKAAQAGIRIDPIAYQGAAPSKGPMLNLGELAKQSLGTFRWAQQAPSIPQRVDNVELELEHQYVLTALVAPDDVIGKKLAVIAQVSASQAIQSNDSHVPTTTTCAGAECPTDGYCADDRCVQRARPTGRGVLGWLLLVAGIAVGALVVLGGIGFVITRLRRKPMPMSGGTPAPQAAPPGAPAPQAAPPISGVAPPAPAHAPPPAVVAGPQLYMMNGPRSGQRVGLRHGFLIGKQPGCDLVLDDDGFASSQHAQILMDQGGNCTLVDKGSTNGTFVNGVRVTQYALTHGVAIRVGSTELRFLAQ